MSSTQKSTQEKPVAQGKKQKPNSGPPAPSKLATLTAYFENSRKELSKVSWPTRKEVKATTFAVIAMVAVMAVFLGVADLIFTNLVAFILSLSVQS